MIDVIFIRKTNKKTNVKKAAFQPRSRTHHAYAKIVQGIQCITFYSLSNEIHQSIPSYIFSTNETNSENK